MKEKNLGQRIILATFIIVICFSWLFWILLGKFVDQANYENRELATRPRLTVDSYQIYSDEYEEYFNDNIPFRNNLITINSAIDYFVFNRSTSTRVIIGKNNFLFYTGDNSIGCYQGTNLLLDEELEAMAQNCREIQAYLNEQGKEFVIFVAPNKERIYYDEMPEQYGTPADVYRALQVVEYLRNNTDIRIVYPYDELMQAKESLEQNIYYKTDTHWNWVGGYVGATALMRELGIEMPDILSDEVTITTGSNAAGDLAGMLNLIKQLTYTDYEYTVEGYDTHNVENIEWDFYNAFIYHAEGADPRKVYVYRDSFGSAISTYIGSQFTDTYMRHLSTYTYEDFAEQNPDIFVYEVVERLIGSLASFSIQ